jgi:hypothetical protein
VTLYFFLAALCSGFPVDEQEFAANLRDPLVPLYCDLFTPEDRQRALFLQATPRPDGTLMTSNEAVEQIARERQIPIPPDPPLPTYPCPEPASISAT